jgi:signal transduction histidine kinase
MNAIKSSDKPIEPHPTGRTDAPLCITSTDENGRYIFNNMPFGIYTLIPFYQGQSKDQVMTFNVSPVQMKLTLEPVLIREVFHQVEKHMGLPADKKGLRFLTELKESDLKVHAHPGRLTQVLLNLVGNSIKFTDSGSVVLNATMSSDQKQVRIHVTDTGIGIPLQRQDRLFQKFVQADGSMTRHFGGSGLGLALSKTLLKLMKGEIELQSEGEGKGTQVTVILNREANGNSE